MALDVQTMQKINGAKMEETEVLGKKIGNGQLISMVWTRDPFAAFAVQIKDQVNPLVTSKYYETNHDVLHYI